MFFLCFDLWFMLNGTKLDTSGSQGHEETLFKRDVKQFEYCSLQICMGVNCVCPVFLFSGLESVLWHSIGIGWYCICVFDFDLLCIVAWY